MKRCAIITIFGLSVVFCPDALKKSDGKGVSFLYVQNDLVKIKSSLADNVGNKVKLRAKRGRKQVVVREGVIESTYPSIFTVQLDIQNDIPTSQRRVSYSYTDVLTKAVELIICDPDNENEDF